MKCSLRQLGTFTEERWEGSGSKWTVQSNTHVPLLNFLETLLHKILFGATLIIYSERGKHFVTSYKRQ